jgi:hypothetical protein
MARRRLALRLMFVALATAILGGLTASPAQAAFDDETYGLFTLCDHNTCDNDWAKLRYNVDFQDNGVCIDVAPWFDNETSGAVNLAPGTRIVWYRLLGCSDILDVPGADNEQDFGEAFSFPPASYVNNKLSSFRVWND